MRLWRKNPVIINYEIKEHAPIYILDGISHKQRTIYVPTLEELIVQHCVVNALKPMFYKGMYEHSYTSVYTCVYKHAMLAGT